MNRCPFLAGGLKHFRGDHAEIRQCDLGLGFIGISLFYREGYFQQAVDSNNWQTEFYNPVSPLNIPVEPVVDASGKTVVGEVEIGMSRVSFKLGV